MNIRIIWKVNLFVFGFLIVSAKPNKSQIANNENGLDHNEPVSRIVGGQDAAEGQFPYQVSLRVYNQHLCGGAIISRNYVVTAAHCVSTYGVPLLEIRAGSVYSNSGGVVIKVAQVKSHPEFNKHRNDIALLKLSQSLQFNNRIKAIPLTNEEVPSGRAVVLSGWGGKTTGGPLPNHLQYTNMKAISFAECDRILNDLPKSEICFVPINGNGICGGDSGGPAAYNGRLVGAANWGINECGSSFPVGYSSVLYNLKWLRENSDV